MGNKTSHDGLDQTKNLILKASYSAQILHYNHYCGDCWSTCDDNWNNNVKTTYSQQNSIWITKIFWVFSWPNVDDDPVILQQHCFMLYDLWTTLQTKYTSATVWVVQSRLLCWDTHYSIAFVRHQDTTLLSLTLSINPGPVLLQLLIECKALK